MQATDLLPSEHAILERLLRGSASYKAIGNSLALALKSPQQRYHPSTLAILVRLQGRGLVEARMGKWHLTAMGEVMLRRSGCDIRRGG